LRKNGYHFGEEKKWRMKLDKKEGVGLKNNKICQYQGKRLVPHHS
jgi:hypothetical protein